LTGAQEYGIVCIFNLGARHLSSATSSAVQKVQNNDYHSPHKSSDCPHSFCPAVPVRDMSRHPRFSCVQYCHRNTTYLASAALHRSCTMVIMSQDDLLANPARLAYKLPQVEIRRCEKAAKAAAEAGESMLGLAERLKNNPRRVFSPDASYHLRQHGSARTLRLMQVLTGFARSIDEDCRQLQSQAKCETGTSCPHQSEHSCLDEEASSPHATTPLHHGCH